MVQLDGGNITQADERVTAPIDNQLFERFDGVEPADGSQQVAAFAGFYFAAGNVSVTRPDRIPHVEDGELPVCKPRRVQQYPYLPLRATGYFDL